MQNIDGITGKARTEWLMKAGCSLLEIVSEKLWLLQCICKGGVDERQVFFFSYDDTSVSAFMYKEKSLEI